MNTNGDVMVIAAVSEPVAFVPGDCLDDVKPRRDGAEREWLGGIAAKPAGVRRMDRGAIEQDLLHWHVVHVPLNADEQPGVAIPVVIGGIAFDLDGQVLADHGGVLILELGERQRGGSRHNAPWLRPY